MQATQAYIFNDARFYPAGEDLPHLPSVTTVLGKTEDYATMKALENWGKKNPGGKEAAANRGTRVHGMAEEYLLTKNIYSARQEEMDLFMQLKTKLLDRFESVSWVEGGVNGSTHHDRVYSLEYGFAGKPDWVGRFNDPELGVTNMMFDLKTSKTKYCAFQPMRSCPDFRERNLGYKKYSKCKMQIAAYTYALNDLTGWDLKHAGMAIAIFGTNEIQYFYMDEQDLAEGWKQFQHRLEIFYRKAQQGKLTLPNGGYIPDRYYEEPKPKATRRRKTPSK